LIHFGEDTAEVDKTILCKGKATADEELECLNQTIEEYGKIQYLSNYFEKDLNGTKEGASSTAFKNKIEEIATSLDKIHFKKLNADAL